MWPFDALKESFDNPDWDVKSATFGWLAGFVFAAIICLIYLTYKENFPGHYSDAEREEVLANQRAKPLHLADNKVVGCKCLGCPNWDAAQGVPKSDKGEEFDKALGAEDQRAGDLSNVDEPQSGIEPSDNEVVDGLINSELHGEI